MGSTRAGAGPGRPRSAGVGVLFATGVYGGRLVFEHAAGIPTEVLQAEMHERAKGITIMGARRGREHDDDAPPATPPIAPPAATPDSRRVRRPPHTPCARHPAAQGLTRCARLAHRRRIVAALAACQPTTTRPPFPPLPEAADHRECASRHPRPPACWPRRSGRTRSRPAGRAAGRLDRDGLVRCASGRPTGPARRSASSIGAGPGLGRSGPARQQQAHGRDALSPAGRSFATRSRAGAAGAARPSGRHQGAGRAAGLVKRYGGPPAPVGAAGRRPERRQAPRGDAGGRGAR